MVTVFQHPHCFQERMLLDYASRAGSTCQATGEPLASGEPRLAVRVLREEDYFNGGAVKVVTL
jgi:hypothetical protein